MSDCKRVHRASYGNVQHMPIDRLVIIGFRAERHQYLIELESLGEVSCGDDNATGKNSAL